MKIILEQQGTGRFYTADGRWVASMAEAHSFPSTAAAIERCQRDKLSGVSIVLTFGERWLDVRLNGPSPMSPGPSGSNNSTPPSAS